MRPAFPNRGRSRNETRSTKPTGSTAAPPRTAARTRGIALIVAAVLAAAACTPASDPPPAAETTPTTPAAPPADPPAPTPEPVAAPPAPAVARVDDTPAPTPEPVAAPPAPAVPRVDDTPAPETDCHPAYDGCLPLLDGDALDCDDVAPEQRPVIVLDPSDDPYHFSDGINHAGCMPTAIAFEVEPPPQPPPPVQEPATEPEPGEEPPPPPVEEPAPAPPPEPAEPVVGGAAPPIGDVGEPTPPPPPPVEEPAPEPQPEPAPEAPAEPEAVVEPQTPPTTEPFVDVNTTEPCSPLPEHAGDRLCLPPVEGTAIRLFSDWLDQAASPDYRAFIDSGLDDVEHAHRVLTKPLVLAVGTVIQEYNTDPNRPGYREWRVTRIDTEPMRRFEAWTDVVYGIFACVFSYRDVDGVWVLRGRQEREYAGRPAGDGRWRVDVSPSRVLGSC